MTNKSIVTLETERLILRQFENSDLLFIKLCISRRLCTLGSAVFLLRKHGMAEPPDTHFQLGGFGYMAVLLKDTDTLIGQAGLHNTEIEGHR